MVLPYQQEMMVTAAKALRATKNAVHKLINQYIVWHTLTETDAADVQLGFPYVRHFEADGNRYEFRYVGSITRESYHLVFRVLITRAGGKLFDVGNEIIVKFTKRYSTEAHDCLGKVNLAPRLFAFVKLPGGWFMIVMEFIAWTPLHKFVKAYTLTDRLLTSDREYAQFLDPEIRSAVISNIKKALEALHDNFFVHGDFRPNNLLVNPKGDVRVVDFEYSGRFKGTDPVRYPPFLNKLGEITWAPDVQCGGLISPEHDHFLFNQIFPN